MSRHIWGLQICASRYARTGSAMSIDWIKFGDVYRDLLLARMITVAEVVQAETTLALRQHGII